MKSRTASAPGKQVRIVVSTAIHSIQISNCSPEESPSSDGALESTFNDEMVIVARSPLDWL